MSGRETLCIAVMSTTPQTWVLPPNGNPNQIFLLFLRESHQESEFERGILEANWASGFVFVVVISKTQMRDCYIDEEVV